MCAALKAFPLHVMVRQVLQNVRYAWVEEILSISTESIFWNESFSWKSKEQMLMHIFHLLHRFYANAEGKPPQASVHILCPVLYCVHFVCIVWWRLKRGYHNLFYSFIGLIGHNTWWENSQKHLQLHFYFLPFFSKDDFFLLGVGGLEKDAIPSLGCVKISTCQLSTQSHA